MPHPNQTDALWHPFTQMAQWAESDNLTIASGEGNWLIDTEGRKYLDGVSSLWINTFGHRRPEIDKAIRDQLERIAHSTLLGLSNTPVAELAQELVRITPAGLNHVFFGSDGASAVEAGMKIGLQYWQQRRDNPQPDKQAFVCYQGAYHGDTLGAVSVGDMPLFHGGYLPLLKTFKLPYPRIGDDLDTATSELDKLLTEHGHEIAAVIIEPMMQCANGMIAMAPGYLKILRDACTQHDVLLIADEVAVGFGKTGKMFACDCKEISPDILVLGKGLTGGYLPVAATVVSDALYDVFLGDYAEFRTFFHGHSFAGNPLGCAAALANLKIFETDKVLARVQNIIGQLRAHLEKFQMLPHVKEIRQCGVMVGIELAKNPAAGKPYPPDLQIGHQVHLAARKRNVLIRPLGPVIVLMPPLSITDDELELLTNVTYEVIVEVTGD